MPGTSLTNVFDNYLQASEVLSGISVLRPPTPPIIVVCDFGQSNSDGAGPTFTYTGPALTAQTYYISTPSSVSAIGNFQTYEFGTNLNNAEDKPSHNRPDPTFFAVRALEQEYPNLDFRVIQYAKGGTGFLNGTGSWATGGADRTAFIEHHLKPAVSQLLATGRDVYFLPITQIQGEADAETTTNANAYQAQVESLLAEIRSAISPSLKFGMVRLNNATTYAQKATIRAAQEAIAAQPGNLLISTDGIAMFSDNTHYFEAGYQEIGTRIATALSASSLTKITSLPPTAISLSASFATATTITAPISVSRHTNVRVAAYTSTATPTPTQVFNGNGIGHVASVAENFNYSAPQTLTIAGVDNSQAYKVHVAARSLDGLIVRQSVDLAAAVSNTPVNQSEFTSATDVLLTAYTPEIGTAWTTPNGGDITVRGGLGYVSGGGSAVPAGNGYLAIANPVSTSAIVQLRAVLGSAVPATAKTFGLICRYVDPANFVGAYWTNRQDANSGRFRMFNYTSGGSTTLQTTSTPIIDDLLTMTMEYSDTEIRTELRRVSDNSLVQKIVSAHTLNGTVKAGGLRFSRVNDDYASSFTMRGLSAFTISQ
jgi:hypothetical protein